MNIKSGRFYKVKTNNGQEIILTSQEASKLLDNSVPEETVLRHEEGFVSKMILSKDYIVEKVN